MTRQVTILMKDRAFDKIDAVLVIIFVQDFQATCGTCNVHEGSALMLFKHLLTALVEPVLEMPMVLRKKV